MPSLRGWPLTVALVAVPIGIALIILMGPARNFAELTRDPAAMTGAPPWLGFLSNVGALYWAAASAIALFAACLASREHGDARFLGILGALLAVLALDDLFLLHEDVAPSLGIPEDVVKYSYAALAVGFAVCYRSRFRGLDRLIALAATAALGASLTVDAFTHGGNASSAVEDGLKFLGISLLLVLSARLSSRALATVRPPAPLDSQRDEGPFTRSVAR